MDVQAQPQPLPMAKTQDVSKAHQQTLSLPLSQTMTMASKAILFTKEDCPPCIKTKEFINSTIDEYLAAEYLVVMKKENHSALVVSYDLYKFPILLLVNEQGEETNRIVGGQSIREQIQYILEGLREASS